MLTTDLSTGELLQTLGKFGLKPNTKWPGEKSKLSSTALQDNTTHDRAISSSQWQSATILSTISAIISLKYLQTFDQAYSAATAISLN